MGAWIARWRRWIAGAAVIVAIAIIGPFGFGYFSVCADCGAVRVSSDRQLPLLPIAYWSSHEIRETALSRTATKLGLIGAHQHRWRFGHGGGNGIVCALGPGQHMRRSAESEAVGTFLESTSSCVGEESAREWLTFILDSEQSRRLPFALTATGFPEAGFSSKDEYRAWRTAAADLLVDMLENPPPER